MSVTGQKEKNRSWEQKKEPREDQHDEVHQQESTTEYLISGKCARTGGLHVWDFSSSVTNVIPRAFRVLFISLGK